MRASAPALLLLFVAACMEWSPYEGPGTTCRIESIQHTISPNGNVDDWGAEAQPSAEDDEGDATERDGDDLHCTVPVGLTTAALGGSIEVPTLGGKAEIELPEGTQHGKTFRLRGKGIKGVRSSYPGDLYCHVAVETPIKLTEHQRKLLKELDESLRKGGEKHSPNAKSLWPRMRATSRRSSSFFIPAAA